MKASINQEKLFSKKWFISYSLIVIGTFIMAAGYVLFINPYNIVPVGVYGIGIVLHHLIPDIPIGIWGLLMDIPLTLIGMKILGPKFGIKTVVGMVLISLFYKMNILRQQKLLNINALN